MTRMARTTPTTGKTPAPDRERAAAHSRGVPAMGS